MAVTLILILTILLQTHQTPLLQTTILQVQQVKTVHPPKQTVQLLPTKILQQIQIVPSYQTILIIMLEITIIIFQL